MSLPSLRKRIDRIDLQLLRLLNHRAVLARRVGQIKRRRGLAVFDRSREQAVLRQVSRANQGPLSMASLRAIFREILRRSRQLETTRRPPATVSRPRFR